MKKFTIADVRKLKVGQTKVFRFESPAICKSNQQRMLGDAKIHGYTITTICDVVKAKVTVTRTA